MEPKKTTLTVIVAIGLALTALAAQSQHDKDLSSSFTTKQVWTGPKINIRENGTPPWTLGAISPDGRYLSFVDWSTGGDLALHDFTTGADRRLTRTASKNSNVSRAQDVQYAQDSTISRDGKRIAFGWWNQDRSELRLLDLHANNTRPRTLAVFQDAGHWMAPFDWSPDGKWVAVLESKDKTTQICLVSTIDGTRRVLKSTPYGVTLSKNSFSPEGRYLAYTLKASSSSDQSDIYIMAMDGSRDTPAVVSPSNDVALGWTPDGKHLLFTSDRSGANGIWAQPVLNGTSQGEPRLVKGNINPQPMGMARSGALYFSMTLAQRDVYVASLDLDTGKVISPPTRVAQQYVGFNDSPEWSRDGKYLVFLSHRDQATVLVIRSMETGNVKELLPNLGNYFSGPLWSPDGSWLTVDGYDKKGQWGIYRIDLQSGEAAPMLMSEPGQETHEAALAWSSDGRTLYFARWLNDGKQTEAVIARDMQTGKDREIIRGTPDAVVVSPAGRFVALTNREGKSSSLLVVPVDGGPQRELLRVTAPQDLGSVTWSADGTFLLFAQIDRQASPPQRSFRLIAAAGGDPRNIELGADFSAIKGTTLRIHADGHQITFNTLDQPKSEIWLLDNFIGALRANRF